MRLTRAGEYAVRCILYLSLTGKGEVVGRREIAEKMNIPDQFLGKVAQQLARSRILEIVQGSKGGFRLLLSPERITLLDVVESTIGEIFLNDCLLRPESCNRSASCAVHKIWDQARNQLRDTLRRVTFAELAKEEACFRPFPSKAKRKNGGVPRRGKTPRRTGKP